MADCEMLNECAFFKKYAKAHMAACKGLIAEYCRGNRQDDCKRKHYLIKHKEKPPENMLPGGTILRLDAQVFSQKPDNN
jgi:hypothetical protein